VLPRAADCYGPGFCAVAATDRKAKRTTYAPQQDNM
jgi:hypothetical protein